MAERLRHRLPMSEGVFTFRVEQTDNGSLVASLHREPANQTAFGGAGGGYYNRYRHRYHHHFERIQDDVGALYYVVAVILIYGCSILMMIASYIRKNKVRPPPPLCRNQLGLYSAVTVHTRYPSSHYP